MAVGVPVIAFRVRAATIRVLPRPLHASRARLVSTNQMRLELHETHALPVLPEHTSPNLVRLVALTALLEQSCHHPEDLCALTVSWVSIKILSVKQHAQTVKRASSLQRAPARVHLVRLAQKTVTTAPQLLV